MYDYNFPKQLSQKRLTLLLLSLVLPTAEMVVLKKIYNKKRELEVDNLQKVGISLQRDRSRFNTLWVNRMMYKVHSMLCCQIRALYPGLIMCNMGYDHDNEYDIVVNTHPLRKYKVEGNMWWGSSGLTPTGISVINHMVKMAPLVNPLTTDAAPSKGNLCGPNFTIGGEPYVIQTLMYRPGGPCIDYTPPTTPDYDAFDNIYKKFREISDTLEDPVDHGRGAPPPAMFYDDKDLLNRNHGLRVHYSPNREW